MENSIGKVPIHLKMTLTAKEAADSLMELI